MIEVGRDLNGGRIKSKSLFHTFKYKAPPPSHASCFLARPCFGFRLACSHNLVTEPESLGSATERRIQIRSLYGLLHSMLCGYFSNKYRCCFAQCLAQLLQAVVPDLFAEKENKDKERERDMEDNGNYDPIGKGKDPV